MLPGKHLQHQQQLLQGRVPSEDCLEESRDSKVTCKKRNSTVLIHTEGHMKGKDCVVTNRSIMGESEMLQRGRVVRQVPSPLSIWRSESTSLPTCT